MREEAVNAEPLHDPATIPQPHPHPPPPQSRWLNTAAHRCMETRYSYFFNPSGSSNMQVGLKTTPGRQLILFFQGVRRRVLHFLLYNVFDISMHLIK